mgnify:CR=1 FL=1|jgi:glucose/arabinose dehydrogenase
MNRLLGVIAALVLLAVSCGSDGSVGAYSLTVLVDGLDGPTQLAITDDAWFVAHLNGSEGDGSGQVLRLDPDDLRAAPVVVLDGLEKPTGVAVFAGELWVMEQRRLTRSSLDGSDRRVVVADMAYNGRSQGTLTVDGDRLLFDTSGTKRFPPGPGGSPVEISGALWAVDGDGVITNVAWGFKHAYAHAVSADGRLWTTEISDGSFDGAPATDELVAVSEGVDHGWPACVGDNRAVEDAGVADPCTGVPRSQAVFGPGATPTGLAVSPWDPSRLFVALWVDATIVEVDTSGAAPAAPVVIATELSRPQHLVVDGLRLLVTDHAAGTIVVIERRE